MTKESDMKLDWEKLRQQKQTLLDLSEYKFSEEVITNINGLINLLDFIQDEAVNSGEVSEKMVFGESHAE
jgi:hypothetical protein